MITLRKTKSYVIAFGICFYSVAKSEKKFSSTQNMISIISLSAFWLCTAAADHNGYEYEVQVEPLRYATQAPMNDVPTGGYTFLGFGKNKAEESGEQTSLDKEAAPGMSHDLLTTAKRTSDSRYILDLALVLDSSYTITLPGWIKVKEAAKKLIDGLDISPEGTHVSIMKFSTDVEAYYMFDSAAGKDKLKNQIDGLEYDGEWSRLDMALQAVDHHVFTPLNGARLGKVPMAVVIFSDGKADGPSQPDVEIDWKQKLAEPVNSLRNKDVQLFSVSAGTPDKTSLEAITDDPTRVFDIDNIGDLVKAIQNASLKEPLETSTPAPAATVTVTVTVTANQTSPSPSPSPSVSAYGTKTVTTTLVVTESVTTTPNETVTTTETNTELLTATETASTLVVTATQTNTMTETVTATATESLTSTALNTATATLTATETATEIVTLTTTVGVTKTTYAVAKETPIPITVMGSVVGRKRNKIPSVKRWYENYIPKFVKNWMAIKE